MSNRYNVTSTDQNFEPLANPMTAEGDIIFGGTVMGGVAEPTALAAGVEGNWLRQGASATPEWGALQTAGTTIPTAASTNVGTWYALTGIPSGQYPLFLQGDVGSSTFKNLYVLSSSTASTSAPSTQADFDELRTNMVASLNTLSGNSTTTTNAGGSALCGSISIPDGATSSVQVLVKGVASDHSLACSWSLNAVAYNNSGTVQIIGNPVRGGTAQSDVGTTWDATIISGTDAGGPADWLYVQVTGQNTAPGGYSITWAATLVLIA